MNEGHPKTGRSAAWVVIGLLVLDLLLVVGFYWISSFLTLPAVPACVHPLTRPVLLSLGATLILNLLLVIFLGRKGFPRLWISLPVLAGLGVLALWLGSYRYSPLNLSTTILGGFQVTQPGHVNDLVQPGGIVVLQAGVPVGINVVTGMQDAACLWSSLNGGAMDGSDSCDPVYAAPSADYDILTVRLIPPCSLPPVRGQLKVSILP